MCFGRLELSFSLYYCLGVGFRNLFFFEKWVFEILRFGYNLVYYIYDG